MLDSERCTDGLSWRNKHSFGVDGVSAEVASRDNPQVVIRHTFYYFILLISMSLICSFTSNLRYARLLDPSVYTEITLVIVKYLLIWTGYSSMIFIS